jgi:hypothetical protein
MLKDEIEKKYITKRLELTRVNLPNMRSRLWDQDNFIEIKLKQIIKLNVQ